jgi:hypothetical protein
MDRVKSFSYDSPFRICRVNRRETINANRMRNTMTRTITLLFSESAEAFLFFFGFNLSSPKGSGHA